ncbi:MAG TPA: c-type cytochrome [Bacteroidia bacterium]|nr:c-type cytochrome [Bacteroidia bacterium]
MIKDMSRNALNLLLGLILVGFVSINHASAADGKAIFKQNCAVCHALTDQKITGPGLKGIGDRAPKEGDWLFNWIKNNEKLIKSGDAYANKIYKENGNTAMTVFEGVLSDDDIKAVEAYILNPPVEQKVAVTGGNVNPNEPTEEKGVNPLYIILAVIVILGILTGILRGVRLSLQRVTRQKEGQPEVETKSFFEEGKTWLGDHRRFVAVCLIVLSCIGMKSCWNSLFRVGVYYDWQTGKGYHPEQPIKFSHKIHAGDNAIACQYCHNSVEKSRHAGIPTVNVCMNCHKGIKEGATTGTKEIAKIYAAAGFNSDKLVYDGPQNPIQWIKVHNLPDHVYFNHSQHVVVGKIDCAQCHGNVKEMTTVEQKSPLTMKWCIECHRKTEVAMAGNPYYDRLHEALKEKYKKEHLNTFTVAQMGGIECAKCHY